MRDSPSNHGELAAFDLLRGKLLWRRTVPRCAVHANYRLALACCADDVLKPYAKPWIFHFLLLLLLLLLSLSLSLTVYIELLCP